MANQVQFRRIRGRVVPIRQQHNVAVGSGLVGAGVGVAVTAAHLAGKTEKAAAYKTNDSIMFMKSAELMHSKLKKVGSGKIRPLKDWANQMAGKSKISGEEALMLGKRANLMKGAGVVVSSGLIGAGATQLLPEKWKKKKGVKETTQAAATVGSMFAIQSGWHLGLSEFGTKGRFATATRGGIKATPHVIRSILSRAVGEVYPAAKKVGKIFGKIKL